MQYKFDVECFVDNLKDKNLVEVFNLTTNKVNELDIVSLYSKKRKLDCNISVYKLQNYKEHIGDFLFFMQTSIIPSSIGIDGLKRFLPIIQNLVDKEALPLCTLNIFE